MLSCLCNESPGSSLTPSSSCRIVSNGKDATHGAAQSEPPPLLPSSRECLCHCEMDRRCWLRRNPPHWLTLLSPFPSHYNPFPSAFKSPKVCVPLLPSLIQIPSQLLYLTRIKFKYKIEIFLSAFFRTFACSNETMSRMLESLVASLSSNPLCSQSLKCYIHALMRDKMEIK